MTLAETCDRIEAALEIVEMPLCKAYLRTLVELGGWQLKEHRAMGEAYNWDRFGALKVRVEEAVGK